MTEKESEAPQASLCNTAAGVWRHWENRYLTSAAFQAALGTGNVRFTRFDGSNQLANETETLQLVYFDRSRDLFQAERIGPDALHTPELLITQGTTFWRWNQSVLRTNHGDASRSQAGDEAKQALAPRATLDGFELTQVGREEVAGRPCLLFSATARPPSRYDGVDEALEPFGMAIGGTAFRIYIDQQDAVVLRVEKWFENQLAESVQWLSLITDCQLPVGVFKRRLGESEHGG